MLAATYTQGGRFEVTDVPFPAAGEGELLLRVTAAALCGTDLKTVRDGHRRLKAGQRIVLGHEFAGIVEAVGAGVTAFHPGQRVGVAPNAGCGGCPACVKGRSNYCPDYTAFGIDRDGAHATHVRIPAVYLRQGNVLPIPDGMSDAEAALLEPLSCVVAGQRAVGVEAGDSVAVFGAGPMGLLHVMLARAAGASRVLAFDPAAARLPRAEELGADATAASVESLREQVGRLAPGGVDVAITAAPAAAAVEQALDLLAPFGRLCAFAGLPAGGGKPALDVNRIHYANLTVTGTTGGTVEDYRAAVRLAAAGRVELERVVAARFGLDRLADAYAAAQQGLAGKVILTAGSAKP